VIIVLKSSTIEKYDSQKICEIYDKWPEIAKKSFEQNYKPINFKNIDHIIFSGMGGSGTLGDVFSSILSKTKIHVTVVKGYILPNTVNNKTLVITTSVSGNTVETMTILDSALKRKCKILAFSSGGKMEKYCKKNRIDFRKIQKIHSPRASLITYLYSMLKILESIIPISKESINESIIQLKQMREKIYSKNLTVDNPALTIAIWIKEIPVIYYPQGLQSVAIRFKNSLQENAKTHVIVDDILEATHNGIVSWEKKSAVQPILLEGEGDYIKTKERWRIIEGYFKNKKIDCKIVRSEKGDILLKIINLIYLLDYCSIYKAILLQIDPSPVKSIDYIKRKVREIGD